MDERVRRISRISEALSIPASETLVHVSVPMQELTLFQNGKPGKRYKVSTSSRAPSCVEDSGGTPIGLHRVEQKIGGDERAGTVFFGRVSTGKLFWEFDEDIQTRNLITSRILWLRGLEVGVNTGSGVDSFLRYIYIHGTNHEDHLGRPSSGGCILLGNEDIIRIYDIVPTGSLVYIDPEGALA